MACFHPKKGFVTGLTKNDRPKLRVLPFEVAGINSHGVPVSEFGLDENCITNYYEIPCGHCIGCRADQAKQWSDRLIMEMQYHDSAYFVTLTYNDFCMPRVHYSDKMTGELKFDRGTLSKRDVQLFIKRLRKMRPDDHIRYYVCGEYGPQTDRPHYHGILFGLHLGDWKLEPFGKSETGNQYFVCSELERIWNNGFVSIEPANEFTCKYVCNYVTKKIGVKPNAVYEAKGQLPPFALQSRRPGIGRQFYEEHRDEIMQTEVKYLPTVNGSVAVRPPRYFRKLYLEEEPELADEIAKRHLIALDDSEDAKADLIGVNKETQLITRENVFKSKVGLRNKI